MVQDVGDIMSLKILHLQNTVKVLQSLVIVSHVGRQVTVDDADIVAIKFQEDCDSPFVPLVGQVDTKVGHYSGLEPFPIPGPSLTLGGIFQGYTQLSRVNCPCREPSVPGWESQGCPALSEVE